jgi:2-keto-4-pentenoate hydratase/2-oxohepta-3-ene-1,7-dioic acid hydratase in catechol pathway
MGKNFDASGSFGPEIVTADELPAGGAGLRIRTVIDGETVQDSHTGDLIFSVAELIATLSEVMTLEPGDVIATGTPSGVAVGRTPPRWLKAGETCTVEIEGIGTLSNPVVAE